MEWRPSTGTGRGDTCWCPARSSPTYWPPSASMPPRPREPPSAGGATAGPLAPRTLPATLVMREGWTPWFAVHLPHGSTAEVWVDLEDGGQRRDIPQQDHWVEPEWVDGVQIGEATFQLPGDLPLGYHRLCARIGSNPEIFDQHADRHPAAAGAADAAPDLGLGPCSCTPCAPAGRGGSATCTTSRISPPGPRTTSAPASCWSTRCTRRRPPAGWSPRRTCRPPDGSRTRSTCGSRTSTSTATSRRPSGTGSGPSACRPAR